MSLNTNQFLTNSTLVWKILKAFLLREKVEYLELLGETILLSVI